MPDFSFIEEMRVELFQTRKIDTELSKCGVEISDLKVIVGPESHPGPSIITIHPPTEWAPL